MRLIDVDRLIFHSCNDMKGDCPYWGSANCGVCQKALITKAEIDNAPTFEDRDIFNMGYFEGKKIASEITEEQAIDKLHETGWMQRHDKEMTKRPKGKWIEETDEHLKGMYRCSVCGRRVEDLTDDVKIHVGWGDCTVADIYPYCHCGADMRGDNNG